MPQMTLVIWRGMNFSTLSLDKIASAGFVPRDWEDELAEYLSTRLSD